MSTFYEHQACSGAGVGDLLGTWRAGGRGGWKPFLHHISKDKPHRGRAVTVKAPQKLPRILTAAEMQAILDACTRLRDRFFFALLHESGCQAGEALGLRHEDIAAAEGKADAGRGPVIGTQVTTEEEEEVTPLSWLCRTSGGGRMC